MPTDDPGPASAGPDDRDPVSAVRGWLAELGATVPEPDGEALDRGAGPGFTVRRGGRPGQAGKRATSSEGLPADPESVAWGIVSRKLAVQARTRSELATALAAKDVPTDTAEEILDRLANLGLVDDAAFARDWVASRQQRRHLSGRALGVELRRKGVQTDHIDQALTGVGAEQEYEAAYSLAERRARILSGLAPEVAYRRLTGVLARRGFDHRTCRRVATEVLGGGRDDVPSGS